MLVYVPDGREDTEALAGTKFLGIGAHPDDLEIMTWHGIFAGYGQKSFTGAVLCDGAGGPGNASVDTRWAEQREAARLGQYAAVASLGFSSALVKTPTHTVTAAIVALLHATKPEVVYTHNLFDAHDTHVAVAQHVIAAIRQLSPEERPRLLYGCEVWGDLDWVPQPHLVTHDVSGKDELAKGLIAVYRSQLHNKRYDSATIERKHAHATFAESHTGDAASAIELCLDMSPLILHPETDVHVWAEAVLDAHKQQLLERLWKS